MRRAVLTLLAVVPLGLGLSCQAASAERQAAALFAASVARQQGADMAILSMRPRLASSDVLRGPWHLAIRIHNPTDRRLRGRVEVDNPNRFLGTIVSRIVSVAPGSTRVVTIPLPGAVPAPDQRYPFTVTFESWDGFRAQRTQSLLFVDGSQ